jgi:hypothetical protein
LEYLTQRRKGRKEKNNSGLGVLAALARANLRFLNAMGYQKIEARSLKIWLCSKST